jgi:uncharacterized Tic20 family protein
MVPDIGANLKQRWIFAFILALGLVETAGGAFKLRQGSRYGAYILAFGALVAIVAGWQLRRARSAEGRSEPPHVRARRYLGQSWISAAWIAALSVLLVARAAALLSKDSPFLGLVSLVGGLVGIGFSGILGAHLIKVRKGLHRPDEPGTR